MSNQNYININPEICKNCNYCWRLTKDKKYRKRAYIDCCKFIPNKNFYLEQISFAIQDTEKLYNDEEIILKNSIILCQTDGRIYNETHFKINKINKKTLKICKNLYISNIRINKEICPYFIEHQIYDWNKK